MAKNPRRADLERLAAEDPGGPVVMLNLLRFAEGGRAAYAEYARAIRPFLAAVGAEIVYAGDGSTALVAEPGQAWDATVLVRYPSRAAFARMVADPGYQAITGVRTAALAEAVLQATTPWREEPGPTGEALAPAFAKLLVDDAARSLVFYQALGFERIAADPPFVHLRAPGGGDLYLVARPGRGAAPAARGGGVLVAFRVGNDALDRVAARAREAGAPVDGPVRQPWHTREAIVTDPDGYRLNFVAPG